MINRLSESKFFAFANKKYNYSKVFEKVSFLNYAIPDNLIMDRLGVFKGYKYPFVEDVIELVKSKKIIPCDFSTPSNPQCKTGNVHVNYKFPHAIFNINGFDNNGKLVTFVDLSFKGKYNVTPQGIPTYYDIPDLTMYHMFTAALVQYKLATNPNISTNSDFYSKIAESYSLIVSKIIDNMFPIISTSNGGYDKVSFLCMTFCLQNMFGIEKESAMKTALKSKLIAYKDIIQNESVYYQTDLDFMNMSDYENVFPIDAFTKIICKEFPFIEEKAFNANLLSWKFNDRMTKNGIFCLDSASSFITMIILGKASIGLYNDMIIKQYLQIASYDIIKEMAQIIKQK
jgi:hypothetical protein